MDALTPAEITRKTEDIWVKKANQRFGKTMIAGILAWMFIALGAVFSITSTAGLAENIPFGLIKLLSWLTFSLWLVLVMIAWSELFTGNALLSIALITRKVSLWKFWKNLSIVYLSNFIWALIIVILVYMAWWHLWWDGLISDSILKTWIHKLHHTPLQAFSLGILCNILVCLWVWIAYSARSVWDKVLWIIFPITAFVTAGFEHSVANMFYLGMAWLLKVAWSNTEGLDMGIITIKNIFVKNLWYVTAGNIIWWAIFVWAVYWYLYLKD